MLDFSCSLNEQVCSETPGGSKELGYGHIYAVNRSTGVCSL